MRRSDPNLSKTEPNLKKSRLPRIGLPLFIGRALSKAPLFVGALCIFFIGATGIIPYLMGLAESGHEDEDQDHYQQALTYFDWALKINPRFADAYHKRAETLCDYAYFKLDNKGTQKFYAQAIADVDKAIALDPKHEKYHRTRERVYECSGNLPEAIKEYGRLLALDPLLENSIRTDRAALYEMLGDEKMARADREVIINSCTLNIKNGPDSYTYTDRADAYKKLGQFEKAAKDYAEASELGGVHGHDERVNNAAMLEKLGKNQDAIASYTKAIELHYDPSKFSKT